MQSRSPLSRADAAALLGVDSSADPGTVRHAWRMWARVAHPDVGGDPEHFARLDAARHVLMQPLPLAETTPLAEPVPWVPDPRAPITAVLRRPERTIALLATAATTLLLATLPGVLPPPVSMGQLAVTSAPAAVVAALLAVWLTRQVLTSSADRGHRITVLAVAWLPLAVAMVVISTLVGSSMLPVLPVLALPLVAAVASLDPGAGLWRPIGLRGE
jgi:hypothetical protein